MTFIYVPEVPWFYLSLISLPDASQTPTTRRSTSTSARTLMSPAAARKKFCGHKLTLKKGRRSRHRYENERNLFSRLVTSG